MSSEENIGKCVVLLENEVCDAIFGPDVDGQTAVILSFSQDTGPLQRQRNLVQGDILIEMNGCILCWTSHEVVLQKINDGKSKSLKFMSSSDYYRNQKTLSCGIIGVKFPDDGSSVVYEIVCRLKVVRDVVPRTDTISWSVFKRFSEIRMLHHQLTNEIGMEMNYIHFPSRQRSQFDTMDKKFVVSRVGKLIKYWTYLLTDIRVSDKLLGSQTFLRFLMNRPVDFPLANYTKENEKDFERSARSSMDTAKMTDSTKSSSSAHLNEGSIVLFSLNRQNSTIIDRPILNVDNFLMEMEKNNNLRVDYLVNYRPTLVTAIKCATNLQSLCQDINASTSPQVLFEVQSLGALNNPLLINRQYGNECILHTVCKAKHLEAVCLLLSNPCINVNCLDSDGCTPLLLVAKTHQDLDIFAELLKKEADTTSLYFEGDILYYAKQAGNNMLMFMQRACSEYDTHRLVQSFDINEADRNGDTLLMIYSRRSMKAMVQKVLQLGGNLEQFNNKGETAIAMCVEMDWHHEICAKYYDKLFRCIESHDKNGLESLVKLGIDINQPFHSRYPLLFAIEVAEDVALFMIKQLRAKVNISDSTGISPMMLACLTAKTDIIIALWDCGIKCLPIGFYSKMNWPDTLTIVNPLTFTAVRLLELGLTKIHANTGDAQAFKLMSAAVSIINGYLVGDFDGAIDKCFTTTIQGTDLFGNSISLMFLACCCGAENIVRLLLEHGAEPNLSTDYGHTCLLVAVQRNDIGITEILLNSGANVYCRNLKGQTALHLAIYQGNAEIVQALISMGMMVHVQDNQGCTPLHTAVESLYFNDFLRCITIIRLLVDADASVELKNKDGRTVLHMSRGMPWYFLLCKTLTNQFRTALEANDIDSIRNFHSIGMECDSDGNHMLVEAVRYSSDLVVSFLLTLGIDVNSRNGDGSTALMWAVKHERYYCVELLLERGADLKLTDFFGYDAFAYCNSVHGSAYGRLSRHVDRSDQRISVDSFKTSMSTDTCSSSSSIISDLQQEKELAKSIAQCERFPIANCLNVIFLQLGALLVKLLKNRNAPIPNIVLQAVECISINGDDIVNAGNTFTTQESLLHSLCRLNHTEAIKKLLSNPWVNINITDSLHCTPLMMVAMSSKNLEIMTLLLQFGANPYIPNSHGFTIHCYAARELKKAVLYLYVSLCLPDFPSFRVVECVKKRSLLGEYDIDDADNEGNTILMHCCKRNHCGLIVQLLLAGANWNIINLNKETALSLSVGKSCGHWISTMACIELFSAIKTNCKATIQILVASARYLSTDIPFIRRQIDSFNKDTLCGVETFIINLLDFWTDFSDPKSLGFSFLCALAGARCFDYFQAALNKICERNASMARNALGKVPLNLVTEEYKKFLVKLLASESMSIILSGAVAESESEMKAKLSGGDVIYSEVLSVEECPESDNAVCGYTLSDIRGESLEAQRLSDITVDVQSDRFSTLTRHHMYHV